jgi:hypothetical protein
VRIIEREGYETAVVPSIRLQTLVELSSG